MLTTIIVRPRHAGRYYLWRLVYCIIAVRQGPELGEECGVCVVYILCNMRRQDSVFC